MSQEPIRPERPNDPEAMQIACDWYIFGFQCDFNTVRDSRNQMLADAWMERDSLKSQLESDAAYIALLEAALIKTDDNLQSEGGQPPNDPVEVEFYVGKHKGAVVRVNRPKEPA
jgi:hypothetical protein